MEHDLMGLLDSGLVTFTQVRKLKYNGSFTHFLLSNLSVAKCESDSRIANVRMFVIKSPPPFGTMPICYHAYILISQRFEDLIYQKSQI